MNKDLEALEKSIARCRETLRLVTRAQAAGMHKRTDGGDVTTTQKYQSGLLTTLTKRYDLTLEFDGNPEGLLLHLCNATNMNEVLTYLGGRALNVDPRDYRIYAEFPFEVEINEAIARMSGRYTSEQRSNIVLNLLRLERGYDSILGPIDSLFISMVDAADTGEPDWRDFKPTYTDTCGSMLDILEGRHIPNQTSTTLPPDTIISH